VALKPNPFSNYFSQYPAMGAAHTAGVEAYYSVAYLIQILQIANIVTVVSSRPI